MFFISTLLTTLALLLVVLGTVSASPVRVSQRRLSRRSTGLPGGVYVCTGPNFSGNCGWIDPGITAGTTACHEQGTGAMKPQSLGPDPGGYCTLFSGNNCQGTVADQLQFPGKQNNDVSGLSFHCTVFSGQQSSGLNGDGIPGTPKAPQSGTGRNGTSKALLGDPNLSGGVGSASNVKHGKEIQKILQDNLGMIGLKSKMYY